MAKNRRIGLFFGGKVTKHLGLIKAAARRIGVELDLISYNRVVFSTEDGGESKVWIRGSRAKMAEKKGLDEYGVLFFRTTGKHWEEVDLIINSIDKGTVVVDSMVRLGKPSYACKAWQMTALSRAGIAVPKTVYGSLWYLYELVKNNYLGLGFSFPVILKGSGGDRGTRVYRAENLEDLERLVWQLRKSETEEGKRYLLQEWIENDGDYRVLVLGKKVLGVMRRSRQDEKEFRNNFSAGGKVEVADLPKKVKELAVRAAGVCGLQVAGVDIMVKNNLSGMIDKNDTNVNLDDYVVLEVNKGPQFKGFMEATGIDVPAEIVLFLKNLLGEAG